MNFEQMSEKEKCGKNEKILKFLFTVS